MEPLGFDALVPRKETSLEGSERFPLVSSWSRLSSQPVDTVTCNLRKTLHVPLAGRRHTYN